MGCMEKSTRKSRFFRWQWIIFGSCLILLSACSLPNDSGPIAQAATETVEPQPAIWATDTAMPRTTTTASSPPQAQDTSTPTPTHTVTLTPSSTLTTTATETATVTITPTYAILRGKVLQQANCRYGPGAPYLYKYGVYPDTVLEIFGRTDTGAWVLVRAIGGTNACWVKADLLEIRGDVMTVEPTYTEVPRSPYYGAMTNVSASREANEVTVFWGGIQLRPGDDSEQTPYVIEAWVCLGGKIIFTPVGSYGFAAKITDEPGCSEPSHARIAAAEKHGYTPWVEIPWPPHEEE
jgi:hypothetical protein